MFNLKEYEYFEDLNFGLTKYAPSNKKVLDVGCGQGLLGKAYREKGNYVVGIDRAVAIKNASKKRLNKFYNEDFTDFKKIKKILGKQKFDVIVFADVLEHIYDPVGVVIFYKQFLKKGGRIFISVPNFVLWDTRFKILFGKYDYVNAGGTREKTHIRIFTRGVINKFIKETNLRLIHLDITPGIARIFAVALRDSFKTSKENFDRSAIMNSSLYKFYVRYIYQLEYYISKLWPGMLAFQYILILEK